MATNYVLDFEKPILELEKKVEEMRLLSTQLDISNEIEFLEKIFSGFGAELTRGVCEGFLMLEQNVRGTMTPEKNNSAGE